MGIILIAFTAINFGFWQSDFSAGVFMFCLLAFIAPKLDS